MTPEELKELYGRQVKACDQLYDMVRNGWKVVELACEGQPDWVAQNIREAWGFVEKDLECLQDIIGDRATDIECDLGEPVR